MKLTRFGAGAILACLAGVPMSAGNIVADPGFEVGGSCFAAAGCTPLHPAWIFNNGGGGSTNYGVIGVDPHSGMLSAFFASNTPDIIEQTLTTTPGQLYAVSFWLDTSLNHSNADFQVFWNASKIYDDPSGTDAAHQFPYTQFTFSLPATGSTTVLEFSGVNVSSSDSFDDVSVTSNGSGVPEPGSWVLTCVGVLAIAIGKLLHTPRASRMVMRKTLCAAMLLVFCGAASAGSITINDLTDTVFLTDNTGGRLGGISCTGETCGFSITGPAGTANITTNALAANLDEPGTTSVSDTLQEQINPAVTFWLFTSDGENGIPPATPSGSGTINNLIEDGTPQNAMVISYFTAAGAPNGTDTIFIQSDVESGVPEPSTWWTGVGGLWLLGILRLHSRAGPGR